MQSAIKFGTSCMSPCFLKSTLILNHSLMPSDKHNSRTAWAADLISSLITVTSSRDVHAFSPVAAATVHASWCSTFVPLCALILSSQPHIAYETNSTLRCYGFEIWGALFVSKISIFSVNSWMHRRNNFHAILCFYILLFNAPIKVLLHLPPCRQGDGLGGDLTKCQVSMPPLWGKIVTPLNFLYFLVFYCKPFLSIHLRGRSLV